MSLKVHGWRSCTSRPFWPDSCYCPSASNRILFRKNHQQKPSNKSHIKKSFRCWILKLLFQSSLFLCFLLARNDSWLFPLTSNSISWTSVPVAGDEKGRGVLNCIILEGPNPLVKTCYKEKEKYSWDRSNIHEHYEYLVSINYIPDYLCIYLNMYMHICGVCLRTGIKTH